jgi:hypothetical protein
MTGAVSVRNRSWRRAGALWIAGAGFGLVGGYATLVVHPGLIIPDLLVVLALALARPRLLGVVGVIVGHGLVWSWLLATTQVNCNSRLLPGEAPYCSSTLPFQSAYYGGPLAWPKEPGPWFPVLLAGALALLLTGLALTATTARQASNRSSRLPDLVVSSARG